MSEGVPIMDTRTMPCRVKQTGKQSFTIILTQGLNRQIRRMCEYLGYNVTSLQRTRIMHIRLDKLAPGKWRYLSEAEMEALQESVAESSAAPEKVKLPKGKARAGKPAFERKAFESKLEREGIRNPMSVRPRERQKRKPSNVIRLERKRKSLLIESQTGKRIRNPLRRKTDKKGDKKPIERKNAKKGDNKPFDRKADKKPPRDQKGKAAGRGRNADKPADKSFKAFRDRGKKK